MPDRKPSTICRARSSKRAMRLIASRCKYFLESDIARQLVFLRGSHRQNTFDNIVRGNAIAFGGEIDDQPMAQDGLGKRLDIVRRNVGTPMQQRPGLAA